MPFGLQLAKVIRKSGGKSHSTVLKLNLSGRTARARDWPEQRHEYNLGESLNGRQGMDRREGSHRRYGTGRRQGRQGQTTAAPARGTGMAGMDAVELGAGQGSHRDRADASGLWEERDGRLDLGYPRPRRLLAALRAGAKAGAGRRNRPLAWWVDCGRDGRRQP